MNTNNNKPLTDILVSSIHSEICRNPQTIALTFIVDFHNLHAEVITTNKFTTLLNHELIKQMMQIATAKIDEPRNPQEALDKFKVYKMQLPNNYNNNNNNQNNNNSNHINYNQNNQHLNVNHLNNNMVSPRQEYKTSPRQEYRMSPRQEKRNSPPSMGINQHPFQIHQDHFHPYQFNYNHGNHEEYRRMEEDHRPMSQPNLTMLNNQQNNQLQPRVMTPSKRMTPIARSSSRMSPATPIGSGYAQLEPEMINGIKPPMQNESPKKRRSTTSYKQNYHQTIEGTMDNNTKQKLMNVLGGKANSEDV